MNQRNHMTVMAVTFSRTTMEQEQVIITKCFAKDEKQKKQTHTCSMACAFALSSSFSRSFSALRSAVDVVFIARKSNVIHSSLWEMETDNVCGGGKQRKRKMYKLRDDQ